MMPHPVPLLLVYPPPPQHLKNNHDIDCQANSMVRVGQASLRTDGEPAQHKHHCRQKKREHFTPCMKLECPEWIPAGVISDKEGRGWDDAQEDDGRNDAMREDDGMVPGHIFKSVSHAWRASA